MRVYYFTSSKHGLDNLRRKRLKISDFTKLNDPFELMGIEVTDRDIRATAKKYKSTIARSKGLLCFSESKYDPVQWAHYADVHKGLCLGFDIPDSKLRKINYVVKRLATTTLRNPNKLNETLTTKFKHWSYEEEHRLIIDIAAKVSQKGLFFEDFSDEMSLQEIYIGYQSDLSFSDIKSSYSSVENNVVVKHARPSFKDFRIVWDQSKKSIHV
ncbi:MAG: DUF2971 domain-containing protein [Enterobacterales bacterium]|nr:DUF2971 domain-containing protein [Enterobacterales bacterium]